MKDLLIYYGWLNSFNSATHGWDNEKVAKELARYELLVFGDGIQTPTHGDYANSKIIIPRILELDPQDKIFGYVTLNQNFDDFRRKCLDWLILGATGIFIDEAGYDFGSATTNGREAFNAALKFIRMLGMTPFVNAWKIEHIWGENNDASYPDSTWNPDGVDSDLQEDDWYLLESFGITSSATFESDTQWKDRGEEAQALPCNVASASVINDSDSNGQDKWDFIECSAGMWGLDAVGSSDASYGATNSKSKLWTRLNAPQLDGDVTKSGNVYFGYFDDGHLKCDFTSGSEKGEIVKD